MPPDLVTWEPEDLFQHNEKSKVKNYAGQAREDEPVKNNLDVQIEYSKFKKKIGWK